MAVQDPLGILDRDLTDFDSAYRTFVTDKKATNTVIIDWHREAFGSTPSDEWVEHIRWRISDERKWWKTLRAALQDAAPLPFEPVPPGKVERLRAQRHYLIAESGTRFTAIEATDFRLYKDYLEGRTLTPVLDQRVACGFNMVRVLGTCDFMFHLYPQDYGDAYYDKLYPFSDLLASKGLYLQFCAFADATRVMPQLSAQLHHWGRVCDRMDTKNVLLELVNENDQPINAIDVSQFMRPFGLCSHGSNGSQAWPPTPHWDWAAFHTNGAPEEQRKVGHNAWEVWEGPTLTNETSRYWEVGMWTSGGIERQKQLAFDAAAGAALLCAGSCFHSVSGKQSQLWTPGEELVARAWARGALSVPLHYQDGQYIRRDDLTWQPQPPAPPAGEVLRAYERRLPDGTGHVVLIHA